MKLSDFNNEPLRSHRAWVVFSDQSAIPALCGLRRNFRHCFVIAHDGNGWYSIDARKNYLDIERLRDDLTVEVMLDFQREQGNVVIEAAVRRHPAPFGAGIYSCVAVTKRFLGIRRPWILTPYQLFCHLMMQWFSFDAFYSDIGKSFQYWKGSGFYKANGLKARRPKEGFIRRHRRKRAFFLELSRLTSDPANVKNFEGNLTNDHHR